MDVLMETNPDVSQKLDDAVESIEHGTAVSVCSEFDENPAWLLEDIRQLKHLERLKLIRAAPEQEDVYRPRSSQKAVACDYEQLPDVLVHSKAEAARGKTRRGLNSNIKKSNSAGNIIVNISREEIVQKSLDELKRREHWRRCRQKITLRGMSTVTAMPRSTIKYIERRQELSRSPTRGSAAFRSPEAVPRPHTAPNRGRPGKPAKEGFLTSNDDSRKLEISARKKSPSPEKYKSAQEERKQRSRILQTVLMGWWYAKNIKIALDVQRQQIAIQSAAATVLQKSIRKFQKLKLVKHAADVVPACLRRAIIRYRMGKYLAIVKNYLVECAKNQKSKFLRQFLYRVRRLQRLIKNWVVTQRARTEVMKRYWDRVEFAYRKGLADEYRAAQEQMIENEKRLKKRARAPIAELWSKTNEKVCRLLKKTDRVQLRSARERAFEDKTEMPSHVNDISQITLGEFEGKISDDMKLKVIHEVIKKKRDVFILRRKMEKIAATQALSSKTKLNEELVRRMLSNYRGYSSHVVRVQLVTVREVARHQRDRSTRAQNVCFLTNPNLGPSFKSVIEDTVYKDIQRKKDETEEVERTAKADRMKRLMGSSRGGILKKSNSTMSIKFGKDPETNAASTTSTSQNLGPSFKSVIEDTVYKDIQRKKDETEENRLSGSSRGGILKKSNSTMSIKLGKGPETEPDDAISTTSNPQKKAKSPKKLKKHVRIQRTGSLDSTDEF